MADNEDLLNWGKYSDIKLVCEDKEFSCHKALLANCSSVFDRMFANENNMEVRKGLVNIEDMSPDELEAFLRFVYARQWNDKIRQHAKALLAAGDKYDIKYFKGLAQVELMNDTNPTSAIDMLMLEHLRKLNGLKKKAMEVIINNFGTVSKQGNWQDLKDDNCELASLIEKLLLKSYILKVSNCIFRTS